MSVSHWGLFPGILYTTNDRIALGFRAQWRELSFDFWCLTEQKGTA